MKTKNIRNFVISGFIVVFSGVCLTALSQGAVQLRYKYPAGKTVKYIADTKIVQDMDFNGQSMLVNIGRALNCEIKASGTQSDNIKLEITIDSIGQNIESPQGSNGGAIAEAKGKVFNVLIAPSGKILDNTEGSKISFTIEGSGTTTLEEQFQDYFPILPLKAVKPGDTWSTNDTVNTKTDINTVWMPVLSDFKYEGTENVDGIECAKISATVSGQRKQTTQSQGMQINIAGPYTGTEILFFALKDGYFVKDIKTTKMTGKIDIPDQNMSFPVVMTVNSTNAAVR